MREALIEREVLLRPLAIRRHGRDFEIKLRGTAFLNPRLAEALEQQGPRLQRDLPGFIDHIRLPGATTRTAQHRRSLAIPEARVPPQVTGRTEKLEVFVQHPAGAAADNDNVSAVSRRHGHSIRPQ